MLRADAKTNGKESARYTCRRSNQARHDLRVRRQFIVRADQQAAMIRASIWRSRAAPSR